MVEYTGISNISEIIYVVGSLMYIVIYVTDAKAK
jgi:hypothetical protein